MSISFDPCKNFCASFVKEIKKNELAPYVIVGIALMIIGIVGMNLCQASQLNFWDHNNYFTHPGPLMGFMGIIGVMTIIVGQLIHLIGKSCYSMNHPAIPETAQQNGHVENNE